MWGRGGGDRGEEKGKDGGEEMGEGMKSEHTQISTVIQPTRLLCTSIP